MENWLTETISGYSFELNENEGLEFSSRSNEKKKKEF